MEDITSYKLNEINYEKSNNDFQEKKLKRKIYDITLEKLSLIKDKVTTFFPDKKSVITWPLEPWYNIKTIDKPMIGSPEGLRRISGPMIRDGLLAIVYLGLKNLITGQITDTDVGLCLFLQMGFSIDYNLLSGLEAIRRYSNKGKH
jgi:hypothetical protein